jgi:hypothetical protein
MGAMNDFERAIVKYRSDGPDAVATCPAGHEMWEIFIPQWDHIDDRWWVAAPVGSEPQSWASEDAKWEQFDEMAVYVWEDEWIIPATREPYRGEVRTA